MAVKSYVISCLALVTICLSACAPQEAQTPAAAPTTTDKTDQKDTGDDAGSTTKKASADVDDGLKTLTIAGPFHVGDGILGTDTLVHEPADKQACFTSLQVPTSAQVGKAVELSFSLTDSINGLKIRIGKSCGAPADFYQADLKLMRDGVVIKDLGRLKHGGGEDVVVATEVSIMKDELDGGFGQGEYKLSVQADEGNQNVADKNGLYEDVAFADVVLTILSGDGSFVE